MYILKKACFHRLFTSHRLDTIMILPHIQNSEFNAPFVQFTVY
ncbi:hypothetical protein CHCC20375_0349 [Bacillus licheniformis]|nr:hypothetical protein CHCC20375_0349 [Bacillus licheniformis]